MKRKVRSFTGQVQPSVDEETSVVMLDGYFTEHMLKQILEMLRKDNESRGEVEK